MDAFKKGDRVHWLGDSGMEVHGTVTRGGSKLIEAIADGMKTTAKGPAECFEYSDRRVPLPAPSLMDDYDVRKYKSNGGEETRQFVAEITLAGKCIAYASNAGRGGSNTYVGDIQDIKRLEHKAEIWAKDNGGNVYEPLDLWLDWYINARPFGGDPKDWLKPLREVSDGDPT